MIMSIPQNYDDIETAVQPSSWGQNHTSASEKYHDIFKVGWSSVLLDGMQQMPKPVLLTRRVLSGQ
jgi:hypothetical protein